MAEPEPDPSPHLDPGNTQPDARANIIHPLPPAPGPPDPAPPYPAPPSYPADPEDPPTTAQEPASPPDLPPDSNRASDPTPMDGQPPLPRGSPAPVPSPANPDRAAAAAAAASSSSAGPVAADGSAPSDSESDFGISPGALSPLDEQRLLGIKPPEGGLTAEDVEAEIARRAEQSGQRARELPPPTTPEIDSDSGSSSTEDSESARAERIAAFTPTPMLPGLKFRPFQLIKRTVIVPGIALRVCEVVRLTFRLPDDVALGFRPLLDEHVKVYLPWTPKPKSYSPTSSPRRKGSFDICVKQYPGGKYSQHLCQMRIGDTVLMAGPFPIPTFPHKRRGGKFVGIVAYGIAITSALPLIRAELHRGEAQRIVLVHANRWRSEVAFERQIRRLVEKSRGKLVVHRIFSRDRGADIVHGRVGTQYLKKCFKFQDERQKRFYVVGNKAMIKSTWDKLWNLRYFKSKNALLRKGLGGTRDVPVFKKPKRKKGKSTKKKKENVDGEQIGEPTAVPLEMDKQDGRDVDENKVASACGRKDCHDGDMKPAENDGEEVNDGEEEMNASAVVKEEGSDANDQASLMSIEEDRRSDEKIFEAAVGISLDERVVNGGIKTFEGGTGYGVVGNLDTAGLPPEGKKVARDENTRVEDDVEMRTSDVHPEEESEATRKLEACDAAGKDVAGAGRKAKKLTFLKKTTNLLPGLLRKRATL